MKEKEYAVLHNSPIVESFVADGTSCAVDFKDGSVGRGLWGNQFVHVIDRNKDQVVLFLNGSHYTVSNDWTVNKRQVVKLYKLIEKRKHCSDSGKYRKLVEEIAVLKKELDL